MSSKKSHYSLPNDDGPFSPSGAFVVQFRTRKINDEKNIAGRVEHLTSGRAMRFRSWDSLKEFLLQVLSEVQEKPP